ncbi:MAG TPA: hypothetical protein VIN67_07870 [Desulfobaccales bacterium]
MGRLKTKITVLAAILLLGITGPIASYGWQPKLDRVVYITLSQACSCTLERCQAGDIIVGNVFTGEKKGLLKRLDYSTDKEAARVYVKQYHITQAPALLFLDAQGNVLWMALGELAEKDITEKLSQFGG